MTLVEKTLSAQELALYQATAQQRRVHAQRELTRRRERAWAVARQAAQLLREQFGATRVVVFGSLARANAFTLWSDVDLAAWGIRPEDTFRAVAALIGFDPEIQVNLVDVAACRPAVREAIEREGIDL